jgi:hypothetical protein
MTGAEQGTTWEYWVSWFNRVPDEWHDLPVESRTWDRFCGILLPWKDVLEWMNRMGQQGWEIFHVREESTANWEDDAFVKGVAESVSKGKLGALGEIGAASPMRDYAILLNTPSGYADRQPTMLFFYARRPRRSADEGA